MKAILKKTAKITGYTMLGLLVLLVVLLVCLRIPAVQTAVANKATAILAEKTGGRLSVERVRIDFIDRVTLNGIYAEDLTGDTLLYAGLLDVNISLWALIGKEINIDGVTLDNATGKLRQDSTGEFNFQYIIDAFASTDTVDKDTTPSAWTVSVDDVTLRKVNFLLDMPSMYLQTHVGSADLSMDKLDLQKQVIGVDELVVKQTVASLLIRNTPDTTADTAPPDSIVAYPLPDIGWTVRAGNIDISETRVSYDVDGTETLAEGFDPNHIHLNDVTVNLEDYRWEGKRMQVEVNEITALEQVSGFKVDGLKAGVLLDTTKAAIDGLELSFKNSHINLDAEIGYADFNALVNLSPNLQLSAVIKDTYVHPDDIRAFVPGFDTLGIINPNFRDKIFLDADIKGKLADIEPSSVSVRTGKHTQAQLKFSAQGLPNYETAVYDITIQRVSSSYNELMRILDNLELPAGLQKFGLVDIQGEITGKLNDLMAQELVVTTQSSTHFIGTAYAKGLPNIDTTYFEVDIAEAATTAGDIGALVDSLPEEVLRLDSVRFVGTFKGTIKDMAINGTVGTKLGKVTANAQAKFNEDYTFAVYDGKVLIKEFDLGAMLGSEGLGKLSMEIATKGQGLDPATLDASLDATVQSFTFNGYEYQNIAVNGQMDSMQFEGKINIDDPNLKFDFDGLVTLRDSVNEFSFTANLDTANLQALKLSTTPLGFSTSITSNIKGSLPDNFGGSLRINDFIASTDTSNVYRIDSVVVDAYDSAGGLKVVRITSPVINGAIAGHYDFQTLPDQLVDYVNNFVLNLETDTTKKVAFDVEQNFELLLTISNPQALTMVFMPKLRLDTATITGAFNSQEKQLNLDVNIPYIEYDNINLGPLLVQAEGTSKKLVGRVFIDSLKVGDNINFAYTRFRTGIFNDSLKYDLVIQDDTTHTALDIKGRMVLDGDQYLFHLVPRLILNNEQWTVSANNQLALKGNSFRVDDLEISKGTQKVTVKSQVLDSVNRPLSLSFRSFKLKELSDLVDYQGLDLGGTINGKLTLKDIRQNMDFTGNLDILNITINNAPVGNLDIDATSQGDMVDVGIQMTGTENDLEITGTINTATATLNLVADVRKLQLKLMDPFLQQFIAESEGYISMNARIKGEVEAPDVDGYLAFNGISTISKINGERYRVLDNKINFNSKAVAINRLQLNDSKNNLLTVDGKVTHNLFQDVGFDLSVNTDEFRLWNTQTRNDQIFYGTVILGLNATVKGPITLPRVNANVITREGTEVYLEPLALEESVTEEDYILFRQPKRDSLNRVIPDTVSDAQYKVQISGIDLTMNFELTEDAKLQVIIDPTAGDSLTTFGSANLTIRVPPVGDVEITGTYTIASGTYRMSYQNLLKKNFVLNPGGTITMTGDPLHAQLNITAVYSTETTTYELISTESAGLSDTEIRETQKLSQVDVLLSIRGDLSSPEMTFDIKLTGNNLNSVAARKLSQIRQDQSELNKQVFAILMLGGFIPAESTGSSNLSTTGSNIALRSVSNLVTQQLKKLTGKIKGFNINLNLDSYQSKYDTETGNNTVTEIGLELSKTFLDNRLEISAGTNVNLQSDVNTTQAQGNFTQFAGDFVLEYKLTESGKYRVKVFNKTDYDALSQSNENKTGVGFTYKHSFGSVLKKNRKKEESEKPGKTPETETPKTEEQPTQDE